MTRAWTHATLFVSPQGPRAIPLHHPCMREREFPDKRDILKLELLISRKEDRIIKVGNVKV